MTQLLGLVLLSFAATAILIVPFIDFLFYLKKKYETVHPQKNKSDTPIHDELMKGDEDTPSGAGILLILILFFVSILFATFSKNVNITSLVILLFTLLSFGALGFVDDLKYIITRRKGKLLGLGVKVQLLTQITIACATSSLLYFTLGLNNLYISGLGNYTVGLWYIPMAAFIIVAFTNAYNISDGLDGLSCGLLIICLFAFLALASASLDLTLASFIGIWIGTLFAFLYFNVWPARIFLGDGGAFAFGATLAAVGLMSGKILALGIIGGMYVLIVSSSLIQILSKKFFKRKILPVAPLHMYFKYIGWPEPKIVSRFWLAQGLFAIFGLWIALLF